MPTKKRYKVQRGDTYMSVAQTTGVDPVALANANSGISTLSPGFYINVPVLPSGTVQPVAQMQAINQPIMNTPQFGSIPGGSPSAPNIPGGPPPGPASSPQIAPGGQSSDYYFRNQTNVAANPPTTPGVPTAVIGHVGSQTIYDINDPAFSYLFSPTSNSSTLLSDTTAALRLSVDVANALMASGLTTDQLQTLGFAMDASGEWVRGAGGAGSTPTPPEPRNAGGWQQSSDGSWHLNRNRAQQERRQERRTQKNEGDGISSAVNWSI